ncbi:ZNF598 isoform 6, partial [Pongo abelii]
PKPGTTPTSLVSAWNSSSSSKKVAQPPLSAQATGSGQPTRKAGKGSRGSRKGGLPLTQEEEGGSPAVQELLSTRPTGSVSSTLGPASIQPSKVGKKKKVGSEKPGTTLPQPPPTTCPPGALQAPEAPASRAEGPVAVVVNGHTEGPALARSTPKEPPGLPRPLGSFPCPTPQEDFPALGGPCPPRMPPPPDPGRRLPHGPT